MIEAKAEWKKNYQVRVSVREFEIDVDEPPQYHGEDTGMMPTELFISSLASCFCLALVFVAKKKRVQITDMRVDVSAEADTKNFRYSRLIVKVGSSIANSVLEEMIVQAKKYCYVSNTISQSCPIEYEID
ncbi:MAG: OsmC family protein [Candidatus Dadabacteria bacterium]|jgi:putative redox protein|nr:MAG: OsmC family peroxiredoxin [Thermodesulfobacteriales bacterium]